MIQLAIPRDDARKRIQTQIKEAEAILARTDVWADETGEAYLGSLKVWRNFTSEMLRRLFTAWDFQNDFEDAWHAPTMYGTGETLSQEIEIAAYATKSQISALRAIDRKLDLLEEPSSTKVSGPREGGMRVESRNIDIFISHSSTDNTIAKALADLFREALSLSPERIRCTSVLEYSLKYGANTPETLPREISDAGVVIGLITPSSTESHWVLFELGARWGQVKPLLSVLAGGASPEILPDPIRHVHALTSITARAVVKFVEDVAEVLSVKPLGAWQYSVDSFVAAAQRVTPSIARRTRLDAEYEEESFLHAGLEWILTPQFFKSYRSVMPADAEPPNFLNTLIRGPLCRECKRDAAASVQKGNTCLSCKTQYSIWQYGALSMPPGKSIGQMHDFKLQVYAEAQAAARRRELKQH